MNRLTTSFVVLGLWLGVSASLVACGSNDENSDQPCSGSVDAITNVDTGEIMVSGDFSEGQPILVVTGDGGSRMQFVPDPSDATSATFTGLDSGTFQSEWLLSCDNGEGQANIDGPSSIQVP